MVDMAADPPRFIQDSTSSSICRFAGTSAS
jgi:hypothetical protein